jgi:hypothetical protein
MTIARDAEHQTAPDLNPILSHQYQCQQPVCI